MFRFKKCIVLFCFSLFCFTSAVKAGSENTNSGSYIGIHVNELVRQLLPNGSSSVNNNFNYLITYIKYKPGYKRGTRMSGNFIFNSISDNVNNTTRITNNNILQYKVGKEKLYEFDKHFSFAYGWDALFSINNSITNSSSSNTSSFNLKSRINNTALNVGTGPGIRVMYKASDRVLLGTDAGIYFSSNINSTKIVETSPNQPFEIRSSDSKVNYSIGISPPISLYLILKIK
jgi:hypothetical protein